MVDTRNPLLIGTYNDKVSFGNFAMSPEQARVTAAYLILMADAAEIASFEKGPTFEECMKAVEDT